MIKVALFRKRAEHSVSSVDGDFEQKEYTSKGLIGRTLLIILSSAMIVLTLSVGMVVFPRLSEIAFPILAIFALITTVSWMIALYVGTRLSYYSKNELRSMVQAIFVALTLTIAPMAIFTRTGESTLALLIAACGFWFASTGWVFVFGSALTGYFDFSEESREGQLDG